MDIEKLADLLHGDADGVIEQFTELLTEAERVTYTRGEVQGLAELLGMTAGAVARELFFYGFELEQDDAALAAA